MGRVIDHLQDVYTGVDLGMPLRFLRHAPQAIKLGRKLSKRTTRTQHIKHARRLRLHQAARNFLPHALRHQLANLAVSHQFFAQRERFRRNGKLSEARRKAGQPQHAQRILRERVTHVAQHFRCNVFRAAVRIDQRAVCIKCHRVDRQITTQQIRFQRDIRRSLKRKPGIAATTLALGAREGIFLFSFRMQKHRKIFAHGLIARRQHLVHRHTNDHVIAIHRRQP